MPDAELIPEPFTLEDGTWIAPRKPGQKRPPRDLDTYTDFHPDDLALADPLWVRPIQPSDIDHEDPDCYADDGYREGHCGVTCGCFVICGKRDPKRSERVWVINR